MGERTSWYTGPVGTEDQRNGESRGLVGTESQRNSGLRGPEDQWAKRISSTVEKLEQRNRGTEEQWTVSIKD